MLNLKQRKDMIDFDRRFGPSRVEFGIPGRTIGGDRVEQDTKENIKNTLNDSSSHKIKNKKNKGSPR